MNITFHHLIVNYTNLKLDTLEEWQTKAFAGFVADSRQVQQDQIFVALKGTIYSTAQQMAVYAQKAIEQGALAVITDMEDLSSYMQKSKNILYIKSLRHVLGFLQQGYLQNIAAQSLARIVAVTGTNGKTTVARLVAELLTLLNQPTAVMGTTGNGILPHLTPSTHTTLQALDLQTAIYTYSQQGAKFISLEASSHGLEQGRLAGTAIEVASFSNLSRDHLDYHGTLEQYAKAKAQLFQFPSLKYVVINQDDPFAQLMQQTAHQNPYHPQILTYSLLENSNADYSVQDIEFSLNGVTFKLWVASTQQIYQIKSPLLGRFNVCNVVQAIMSVEKLGFDLNHIVQLIPQLKGASGRMQTIADHQNQRLFIVDYAHTPDALEQVLSSLRHHVENQLWVVFGCGGDRDRGKRPMMTQVAFNYADQVVLTSDNPRSEDPEQIIADMKAVEQLNHHEVISILDRREAIQYAVKSAKVGDIIVIAGKGHENYQEINGVRHWFDDVVEVESALKNLGYGLPSVVSA